MGGGRGRERVERKREREKASKYEWSWETNMMIITVLPTYWKQQNFQSFIIIISAENI